MNVPFDQQPAFAQMMQEMQAESAVGLSLAAQLGSTPSELSLVLRTTLLDNSVGALRPVGYYLIKMISLTEHKMALGMFNHMAYVDDHPLLYHHNAPSYRIFVTNPAADPDAVLDQIEAAHTETFAQWRTLDQDLNKRSDPHAVLSSGMGLLMETPKPFADAVKRVLAANNIGVSLIEGEPKIGHFMLFALDNSYFVARSFSIEAVTDQVSDES